MEHNNLLKNTVPGFIPSEITPDQWHLGGTTGIVGDPLTDGHWVRAGHIPDGESQSNPFLETYDCTGFQITNSFEIIWHRLYGVWRNFSDRWVAIVAGTEPGKGNDPHAVAEAVRKNGLIDESSLPFDQSVTTNAVFYSPRPPTPDLVAQGQAFLGEHTPNHDWVDSTPEAMMDALRFSPLGIAISGWYRDADGLYYFPPGTTPNHATTLADYEEGKWWIVFDSYPDETGSYLKRIRWDSVFPYKSKRYSLGIGRIEITKWQRVLDLIGRILKIQALLLKQKEASQPTQTPAPVPPTPTEPPAPFPERIIRWATAVKSQESAKPEINNPGNLKYSTLTASWGAKPGFNALDGGSIAKFPAYQVGFDALCNFLKLGAEDELKAFHQARTLGEFTQVYACPPPGSRYAENVAAALGCSTNTDISTFL